MASYAIEETKNIDRIFRKLEKRSPKQLSIIAKKIDEIVEDPYRFKPLHAPMQGCRRVHIDKSFVLVYSIDEDRKVITLEDYAHHDEVYE